MNKAELYIHYYRNPLPVRQPPPVEVTRPGVVVLEYPKWIKNKCKCCGVGGATGIWKCEFTTYTVPYLLCATCGLREAFQKWNGFFSPKLLHIDLMVTLTYESRQPTKEDLR